MSNPEREVQPNDELAQRLGALIAGLSQMNAISGHIDFRKKTMAGRSLSPSFYLDQTSQELTAPWHDFIKIERQGLAMGDQESFDYRLAASRDGGSIDIHASLSSFPTCFGATLNLKGGTRLRLNSFLGQGSFMGPDFYDPKKMPPTMRDYFSPADIDFALKRQNGTAFEEAYALAGPVDEQGLMVLIKSAETGYLAQPSVSLMEYDPFCDLMNRCRQAVEERETIELVELPKFGGPGNESGLTVLDLFNQLSATFVTVNQESQPLAGALYLKCAKYPFVDNTFVNPTFLNNLL